MLGVFQFLQENIGVQDLIGFFFFFFLIDFGWPNMFRQQIYRTERNKWPEEKVTVENKDPTVCIKEKGGV